MGRVVRLTENELHSIIKESVNNILSELDWRTYASASDKAYKKSEDAKTPTERRLRRYQVPKFSYAANKAMAKEYDGVDMNNLYDRNKQPIYKRIDKDGNTLGFLRTSIGYKPKDDDVVPVSIDKQINGHCDIERFKRGGDEYVNGKWREKVSESKYSDEPFVLSGDYTDSEKKKIEKKRKDSEKKKQNIEKNEQKKKAKRKEEEKNFFNKQKSMGYKELFEL